MPIRQKLVPGNPVDSQPVVLFSFPRGSRSIGIAGICSANSFLARSLPNGSLAILTSGRISV